ncbi:MAG: pilus assembly protein PilM [Calditrichaeota bacterium]|nr:pilus assembly protein PilM [Calditrichota bacterium]
MKESKGAVRSGIFVSENDFKYVEVERSALNQVRIKKIFQTSLESPLNLFTIQNDSIVEQVGLQIREILDALQIRLNKVVFALDSSFALIKKIIIDSDLSEEDLIDQVDWEVKQFSYSPDDEYIVDFDKIDRLNAADDQQDLVIVSVREKIVQQLRKLFRAGRLSVGVIDLDLFAAIRTVDFNYGLRAGEDAAIVDASNRAIKFTLLKGKEFYNYHEVLPTKSGDRIESFSSLDENNLFNIVATELKKFVLNSRFSDQIENISRIFLHGNLVRENILEMLRNSYNVRIDMVNPFRDIKMTQSVTVDEKISVHPETFTVCVGSALRTKD